ncbi:MAG: phospho-N-acetylmuramoyl-pentapeptide-transferase [Bacteroidales bacterium]
MIKFILSFFGGPVWIMDIENLYSYVTFRALLALIVSIIFMLLTGHRFILWLNRIKMKDTSGDFISIPVGSKRGTPTAGGILIILATLISSLLLNDLNSRMVHLMIAATLFFGFIGYLDDLNKVRKKSSIKGLSQRQKTMALLLFIVPFSFFITGSLSPVPAEFRTQLFVPFYKYPILDLGWTGFSLFLSLAIYSIVNSINITDGQDGALSGLSVLVTGVYCIFAFIISNYKLSGHYYFPFIPGTAEIVVFGAAMIGAVIGFLWFNTYPAEVFMGDTGSLAIGGNIALMAVMTKQEVLFLIIGGVFTFEILTSLLQEKVGNQIGQRIFTRAPYHHSLTHKGIAEPKAVMRLLLVGIILAAIGLLSVKIR